MTFLFTLLLGGAWAFYAALLLDRPDLARIVPEPYPLVVHGLFVVLLLWAVARVSSPEIRSASSAWRHGPMIFLRNLVVVSLGVVLLVFTSREILHGIDPTGVRPIW